MEERRRSKRAFVVAWLLTLGFALGIGMGDPASTIECDGVDCVDPQAQTRTQRDVHSREWRGRQPQICTANSCGRRRPTFCTVAASDGPVKDRLRLPRHRDPCAPEPHFRTARTP